MQEPRWEPDQDKEGPPPTKTETLGASSVEIFSSAKMDSDMVETDEERQCVGIEP